MAMDRYRAYFVPGEQADHLQLQVLAHAEARAAAAADDGDQDAIGIVALLAEGTPLDELDEAAEAAHREFMVRFQQTCGPVMAKAIEDTAFYRYARLTGLNEVGGDPGPLGLPPEELHDFAARQLAHWPTADDDAVDPRHEAVRGRPGPAVGDLRAAGRVGAMGRHGARPHEPPPGRGSTPPPSTSSCRPRSAPGRSARNACRPTPPRRSARRRRTRRGPTRTTRTRPPSPRLVTGLTTEPALTAHARGVGRADPAGRAGHHPRPEAAPARAARASPTSTRAPSSSTSRSSTPTTDGPWTSRRAASGWRGSTRASRPRDLDDEKLLVTSRALRLRRDHPEWFTGPEATYAAVPASSEHAVAVGRGTSDGLQVVAVATRLSEALASPGGWGAAHRRAARRGPGVDLLTGRGRSTRHAGPVRARRGAARRLPVALLVRT